ncbi:MAG: hypothetical protein ACD_56C00003G0001, partial [uncultured bacterium]
MSDWRALKPYYAEFKEIENGLSLIAI